MKFSERKTIDKEKIKIGHNISIREFMFSEAVTEYEKKHGKLSKEGKDTYKEKYINIQNFLVDTFTKRIMNKATAPEREIKNILEYYHLGNMQVLTQEQVHQYYVDVLEQQAYLPQILNKTFQNSPDDEQLYPIVNNRYTQQALDFWQNSMSVLKKETSIREGVSYEHIRNQFIFHQVVETYNKNLISHGNSKGVITTSHARAMSRAFEQEIEKALSEDGYTPNQSMADLSQIQLAFLKNYVGLNNTYQLSTRDYERIIYSLPVRNKTIMKALNTVFEQETGNHPFSNDEIAAKAQYNGLNQNFLQMIDSESLSFKQYIPLSPYDPLFSSREAFLQSGCELLFVKIEDIENEKEDADIKTYRYHRDKHIRDTYDKTTRTSTATSLPFHNFEAFISEGKYNLETENDATQLSSLLPYISKDELSKETLASLNNYISVTGTIDKMSESGVEKSIAILKHLRGKGVNYTIVKGYDAGELDAKITGTPYSVKILTTKRKEKFLGMVYNSKTTMSARLGIDVDNVKSEQMDYDYNIEDTLKMIDYVLNIDDIGTLPNTDKKIGEVGTYDVTVHKQKRTGEIYSYKAKYNETYYTTSDAGYRFAINTRMTKNGEVRRVMVNMGHTNRYERPLSFTPSYNENDTLEKKQEKNEKATLRAEAYLKNAIQSAEANFRQQVNLEYILDEYRKNVEPKFSSNTTIEAIQKYYWSELSKENTFSYNSKNNKLTNEQKEILARQHFETYVKNVIGTYEQDVRNPDKKRFNPETVATYMVSENGIVSNRENIVRAMKRLNIPSQELRGNEYQNQMFTNRMLKYHPSANSQAMLTSENPFIRDIGITIKNTLLTSGCKVEDKDIKIDENGMVFIQAKRKFNREMWNEYSNSPKTRNPKRDVEKSFTAEFGQIFIPDQDGMIKTKFAGTENYATIPGNELYVIGQNEDGPLQDRIRIRTFKNMMQKQAEILTREALYSGEEHHENSVGFSSVYSKLKSEHLPLNYKEEMIKAGMSKDVLKAIMDTAKLQCTWENAAEIRENSTLLADVKHSAIKSARDGSLSSQQLNEIVNDNFRNLYDIMGRNNINQLGHWCDGLFDLSMTSGAKNQGINIYLNPDSNINLDGTITPAENIYKKVPILEHMRYSDYDAWDRVQMTTSNFMRALRIAEKTKTAQMEFGGWTFDDGYVISKKFAEQYQVKDAETGEMRSLMIGDKISDNHGNKGVISLVIDPEEDIKPIKADYTKENLNIDLESFVYDKTFHKMRGNCYLDGKKYTVTADDFNKVDFDIIKEQIFISVTEKENERRKALCEPVKWFKANPELDVIGAPYSAVSRFNGGSGKELTENTTHLVDPYGKIYKNGIGEADYIVTAMTVDKKTHTYGNSDNGGRKASAQLAWALNSQGADKVMKELYGNNNASYVNFREYMILFGMDMDNKGNFLQNYTSQIGEERNTVHLYMETILNSIEHKSSRSAVTGQLQPDKNKEYLVKKILQKQAREEFVKQLDNSGFMEIPFPIKLANDEIAPQLENGNYRLSVLPKHLRSEQSFQDGRSSEHEYTKNYTKIYDCIFDYVLAEKNIEFYKNKNDGKDYAEVIKTHEENKIKALNTAQASYDRVVDSIVERKFSNKNNFAKDDIMGNRNKKSATAVWTANPKLMIDQVAVSSNIAMDLELVDDGYVLLWRDPMLRDAGVRYLRVKIDDNLKSCVSINPAMDKGYEGDFDGDTVGLIKLEDKEAILQAKELLSVNANLLDYGTGGDGKDKALMMQESLDIKSVEHGHPEIKERFANITKEVNQIEKNYKNDKKRLANERNQMVKKISELYKDTFLFAFIDETHNPDGCYNVWDKEQKEHIKRLEHMVNTGAKGSIGKLKEYAEYLGVAFEVDDNNKIIENSIRTYDKPFGMYEDTTLDKDGKPFNERYRENGKIMTAEEAARTKKLNTQIATAVKSTGTGIAGAYSQRGMRALRNQCPRAVLEMTAPVTQAILQAKHDEKEARIKFKALMGVTRKIWNAEKVEKQIAEDGTDYWVPITDNKGEPIKTTYAEFISQFKDVYKSPNGLNIDVNFDYIKEIAKYMLDPEDVAKHKLEDGDNFDFSKCKMRGIEDADFLKQYESPMDKLAYSYGKGRETIKILKELADPEKNNGVARNLYEGKNNSQFMPSDIRHNQNITAKREETYTQEMSKAVDAINKEIIKDEMNGLQRTNKAIAEHVKSNYGIQRSQNYLANTVSKEKRKSARERENGITSKETQVQNIEKQQLKAVNKVQKKLGLENIEINNAIKTIPVAATEHNNIEQFLTPEMQQLLNNMQSDTQSEKNVESEMAM